MKILLFLFMSFNLNAATKPTECGWYEIYGEMKKNSDGPGYLYLVNQGTLSEYKFSLPPKQEIKLSPYLNVPSKIKARIAGRIRGYQGEFASIENAEMVAPDSAKLTKAHGFYLISKEKCQ